MGEKLLNIFFIRNYLLELVSDVLDISRIEEGRMTVNNGAFRLEELVEEVVDSFQGQMQGKNIDFVVDKDYRDRAPNRRD